MDSPHTNNLGAVKTIYMPVQGIYQENGAGTSAWIVISSRIQQTLRKKECAVKFKKPVNVSAFSFEDDMDLGTADENLRQQQK